MRNKRLSLITISLMAIIILGLSCVGCQQKNGVDYSLESNWAVCEKEAKLKIDHEADVFFICPTAVGGDALNMDINDQDSRDSFLAATLMEKGIYDDNARFFAPYYRQSTLAVYDGLDEETKEQSLLSAYEDVKTAFDYYLDNYNEGRPIVLAGFSQGGDMVKRLMVEYGGDPYVSSHLVASYMIGWYITDEELAAHPHLQMAEAEADTGVIVSFCSESEDNTSSIIVPATTKGINPLNWKTDETPADKALNTGACFMDGTGEIYSEIPELTGAYIDPVRGTLKVTDVSKEDYPAMLSFLDEGNYHIYDYMFFYRNLEQNVQTRIDQFVDLKKIRDEKFGSVHLPDFKNALSKSNVAYDAAASEAGLNLAPGVTNDMCNADYWLRDSRTADKVILSENGIAEFNESLKSEKLDPGCFDYYVGNNRAYLLSKEELKDLVGVFELPKEDLFYIDGKPVEDEFWEKMIKLRDLEGIPDIYDVTYGVTLESADIRMAPTDVALAASEDYDYCDELQNSSVRMNEPVVVVWKSLDWKYYFVVTPYCAGWIDADKVGITYDYDYWMAKTNPTEFVVVTDNHANLDEDPSNEAISGRGLDMGTTLELVTDGSFEANNYNRKALNNYMVMIPAADGAGMLTYENAYLPQNISVSVGYLEYTQRNVVDLAFKALGEQYGWAGLYGNRDCSQYMMEMYRCFGINLPRNTKGMINIPWTSLNVTDLSDETKGEILEDCPIGTLLIFPGHVMMYLGEDGGDHYVISATGSMKTSEDGEVTRFRSVLVNSLESTWRGNGRSWLDSITYIKLPLY